MIELSRSQTAAKIDATLLAPTATSDELKEFISLSASESMRAVCIQPRFIPLAKQILSGAETMICTVNDFPHGAGGREVKIEAALRSVDAGAEEIDTVAPLGLISAGEFSRASDEIAELTSAVEVPVKVIIETALWSPEVITTVSDHMLEAGVAFLKTSTGFNSTGATLEAVRLLRAAAGDCAGVKASGGVKSHSQALEFFAAGADVIGSSAPLSLLPGEPEDESRGY